MTNIHLRALMRPAQLVWATPGMMMILDDDNEDDNSILLQTPSYTKASSS